MLHPLDGTGSRPVPDLAAGSLGRVQEDDAARVLWRPPERRRELVAPPVGPSADGGMREVVSQQDLRPEPLA